eukprot:1952777-Pleurochrysis_carterae.AAC.1
MRAGVLACCACKGHQIAESYGIREDSKGEVHTSLLAKGARMLGQNSDLFSEARDTTVVVLHNPNKLFGTL